MLTHLQSKPHRISGVSVGGVYTSLLVPELDAIFDVGVAPRSFVGASRLFLSHAHADHVGALPALLGQRGLAGLPAPKIFLPKEIFRNISEGIAAFNRGMHRAVQVQWVAMEPGQEECLGGELWVKAVRTLHSVPSLGYYFFRRVRKLRSEYLEIASSEIAAMRKQGRQLFQTEERPELAYVTDTLIDVLDRNPELYQVDTLILECTFLDERKNLGETREKFHVHLDEIIERADLFENQQIVLMHFSQVYHPNKMREILKRRLPASLYSKIHAFAPAHGPWPG